MSALQVDTLDLTKTPLEYFQTLLPDEPPQELRKRVGRFGVSGENQTTQMAYLSNGIKSRVVFAKMALRSPHLLLLDEPTNGCVAWSLMSNRLPLKRFCDAIFVRFDRSMYILASCPICCSLDMETIDSLADAINHFSGGVVVVSHDMRLLQRVAKQIVEVADGKITVFRGDIMEYKEVLRKRIVESMERLSSSSARVAAAAGKK